MRTSSSFFMGYEERKRFDEFVSEEGKNNKDFLIHY